MGAEGRAGVYPISNRLVSIVSYAKDMYTAKLPG